MKPRKKGWREPSSLYSVDDMGQNSMSCNENDIIEYCNDETEDWNHSWIAASHLYMSTPPNTFTETENVSSPLCTKKYREEPPLESKEPSTKTRMMRRRKFDPWRCSWARFWCIFILLSNCFIWSTLGSEDWTTMCPKSCRCTWVSGKRTAECNNAGYHSIPTGLSSEVQVLDLSSNSISTLTKDAFKSVGLVNLQRVFLRNCNIERVHPNTFQDLKLMIELDLSDNKLTSLHLRSFDSNERLRELKLNGNPLRKLNGTSFPPLLHLKNVDLSDCQLSHLPPKTFMNLVNLQVLSLSGNQFEYLDEEVLRPLKKLISLSLDRNPWRCDCRLKSFRDWVISKNLFRPSTKCAEPAHLVNFSWNLLMHENFACRPEIVTLKIDGKATEAYLVYGDVGRDITLECLVRANPAPEVKWVRDGQVLQNDSRAHGKAYLLHISGDDERWVNLTILEADPEDAGEYTCVGTNNGGVVERNLTLNFQHVPSGAGVRPGVGGLGSGGYRDQNWIWILVSIIALLVFVTTLIMLVCYCSRKRRVKTSRAQDMKNENKVNGSVAGYTECPTQTVKSNVAGKQTQVITLSSVDSNMINSTICPPPPNLLQSHQLAHQYMSNDSLQHGPGSGRCGTLVRASPAPSISPMNQSSQQYPKSVMVGMTGSLRRVTMTSAANTIASGSSAVNPIGSLDDPVAAGAANTLLNGGRTRISMDGYESVPQTEFELGDLYSTNVMQHPLSHFPPPPQFNNGQLVSSSPMSSSGSTTIVYGETCLGMGCPGLVASATSPVPSVSFPSPSSATTGVGMEIVETKFESDNLVILTRPNVSSAASSNASVTASIPTSLLSSPGSGSHVVVPVHSFSTSSTHNTNPHHHNHVHLLHHAPCFNTSNSGGGNVTNGTCSGASPCSSSSSSSKPQLSSTSSKVVNVANSQQQQQQQSSQVWPSRDVIHVQQRQPNTVANKSQVQFANQSAVATSLNSGNGTSGHFHQCSPQLHTQQTQTGSQYEWQSPNNSHTE